MTATPDHFGRKALFRSAMVVTGSTYVTYIAGLLASTLVARGLGPADFGRYSYLVWLSGILVVFCTNGLTTSGIRFISESVGRGAPQTASDVYGWSQRRLHISMLLVLVGFGICMPYIEPTGWSANIWLFAFIALISSFAKTLYLFHSSMAKGYGIFGVEATTTNVMSITALLGTVILAATGQTLFAYLLLFVGVSLGHAILTHIFIRKTALRPTHGVLESSLTARMQRHLAWTILLAIVTAFSNKSLETFLLNKTASAEDVGYFVIAAMLTRGGIDLLSNGLSAVLMPTMAHAFGAGGAERVNAILANSVRYFLFLGLLLAGAGFLWADPAIHLLYGPQFAPTVLVLQVMVIVGGITLADGAFGALLSTTDHQGIRAGAALFYLGLTAITAFLLIPTYGLLGALAAHAISRVLGFTAVVIGIVLTFKVRLPYSALARLLAAAGLGVLAATLVLSLISGLVAQVLAGIVYVLVYGSASVVLRAWHASDAEHLLALLARLPARFGGLRDRVERWTGRLPGGD